MNIYWTFGHFGSSLSFFGAFGTNDSIVSYSACSNFFAYWGTNSESPLCVLSFGLIKFEELLPRNCKFVYTHWKSPNF